MGQGGGNPDSQPGKCTEEIPCFPHARPRPTGHSEWTDPGQGSWSPLDHSEYDFQ